MKARRLSKQEFVPFAPSHVGEVRVNHKSDYCSGDSDSMIVERKDDGAITAYCFRCSGSGYFRGVVHYRRANERHKTIAGNNDTNAGLPSGHAANLVVGGIGLPSDVEEAPFPKAVHDWLSKAGLTAAIIKREQYLWSDEKGCLFIPVRQLGELKGYVRRFFNQDDRYRNLPFDKSTFFGYYRKEETGPTKKIVIVEDVSSGLRVQEICDTMVLLTTYIKPTAVTLLMEQGYEEAVVFLDADNPTVRLKTRRIARKLSWMKVKIVETGRDPKYYSKEQLEELIK